MRRALHFIHMKMTIQVTIQSSGETIYTFQLKRGMSNIIAVMKDFGDLTLDLRARANVKIIGENVRRHRTKALCETPDVDIMDTEHAIHLSNVLDQGLHVNITGCGFEQNINRISQNPPGVIENQKTD